MQNPLILGSPKKMRFSTPLNKHSDACIYLPPYKLDVLKIVKYKFLPRAIGLKFYYVIADPKLDDQHICPKFSKCNSFQVTSDFTHDGS